jgi:lipoyl(octanoyl) transferase
VGDTARLIVDSSANSGAWNMALDEALLESAVHRGRCTVRIYRWSEPTVSLGYFQRIDEIEPESPWAGLPHVRRLSGGGAVLHHLEWTYSCTVPSGHPAIRVPNSLYELVHRRIIDVLKEFGVDAALRGDAFRAAGAGRSEAEVTPAIADCTPDRGFTPVGRSSPCRPSTKPAAQPFLCFSRGDARDVVLRGRKIVGSAQRRRKGAVLQHGSILLQASPFAPQLPGIVDLADDFLLAESLGGQIGRSIAASLTGTVIAVEPAAEEVEAAAWIQSGK